MSDDKRPDTLATKTCSIPDCRDVTHKRGMCVMHYFRWRRQGNPYIKASRAACPVCIEATKLLSRPIRSRDDLNDVVNSLYLLYRTGSAYQLRDRDERGREYDMDVRREA